MKSLYMAPMNQLCNNSFRNLCLEYGADYVFSELIWAEDIIEYKEHAQRKLKTDNISKTIFQIGAKDINLIALAIKKIKEIHPKINEINYNMGCPQSSLAKELVGGGILFSVEQMEKVAKIFADSCAKYDIIPSIKLRLGTRPDNIQINEYIQILSEKGVSKFYIHGRTLRHPYSIPAKYDEIAEVKKSFHQLEIIYNGDVRGYDDYKLITKSTKCDGVMIGRKGLEDPSVFLQIKNKKIMPKKNQFSFEERKDVIQRFLEIAKEDDLDISLIKMNLSWMTRELEGGSSFRQKVNKIKYLEELNNLIE